VRVWVRCVLCVLEPRAHAPWTHTHGVLPLRVIRTAATAATAIAAAAISFFFFFTAAATADTPFSYYPIVISGSTLGNMQERRGTWWAYGR